MKEKARKFTFANRIKSFSYAFKGIALVLRTQINAWIHGLATALVVLVSYGAGLSYQDWSLIVVAIVMVWTAESLNTALEFLSDAVSTEYHPLIEKAKDVAAGAVLISAIGALSIGILVFSVYFDK